ncbi:MAG: HEAT repeat domain-containing protein [Acidimicrobiia bacterium]
MDADTAACVEELEQAAGDVSADPLEIVDVLRSFDAPREAALIEAAILHMHNGDDEVRRELAMFLGRVGIEDEALVVAPLVELMNDDSDAVRYWASYSLGSLRADNTQIREAFMEGTGDFDPRVRAECVEALARRRDQEVAPIVEAALEDPDELETQYLAAAAWLGLPAFADALASVVPWDELSGEFHQAALERCDPQRSTARVKALAEVLAEVETAVLARQPTWSVAMSEHRFGRRPHPSEELSIRDHEGSVVGYGAWSLLQVRGEGSASIAAETVMADLFPKE